MSGAFWNVFRNFGLRDALDIAIVAFVLYRVLRIFQGTLAAQMLAGLALLMAARYVSREAGLHSLSFILDNFWSFWVLALIVLFQPELRRTLAQAGRSRLLERVFGEAGPERRHVVHEVVRAAESLAAKRIGALIVLERTTGLRHYAELGMRVDATVSAELLGSVFLPGSPLHDGAVFVQHGRITVAGCFLPLSRNLRRRPHARHPPPGRARTGRGDRRGGRRGLGGDRQHLARGGRRHPDRSRDRRSRSPSGRAAGGRRARGRAGGTPGSRACAA